MKGEIFIKYIIICITICAILLTGCTKKEEVYSKELAKIFPSKINTTAKYFGLAEYGHSVTIKDIKDETDVLTYYIDGYLDDARGENPDKRQFNVTYIIDDKTIKEVIVNDDEFRQKGVDNRIHSIIPNQIILKLPLEVNNSWEQKFTFNNKEYVAKTIITEIKLTEKETKQYTTMIVINNVSGYFNKQYIEERVYEQNKGLISFKNTMEQVETDIEPTQENFMFGYQQSNIEYPK